MPEKDRSSKNILKFIALIFFVIAIIVLFKYTPIRDYISAQKLQQFIQSFGFWAPLVYIIIYTIGPTLMFPGSILSLAGGLAFGPIWGTIYTVLGATIGACGAFWVARIMGRGFVEKLAKGKLKTFDDSAAEHGIQVMLFLRLVPLFPFNALNYAAGLSKIRDSRLSNFSGYCGDCLAASNGFSARNPFSPRKRVSDGGWIMSKEQLNTISRSKLLRHVEYLAGLGHRISGTENDQLARQYIGEQFKATGLQVKTEPFDFTAYRVNRAVLRISQPSPAEIAVSNIHFDPYKASKVLKGRCVFLPKYQATESELENYARQLKELKEEVDFVVIVTDEAHRFPAHHVTHRFGIFEHTLQAVAVVSSAPEQIQDSMGKILTDVELAIEGQMETHRTANIAGVLPGANSAEEIIMCAHHDSYSCPGANDNASGVSVLIKLANIFGKEQQLPRAIRFVAFGAEEWGNVGSRVYVKEHAQELQRALAVINLDSVGGEDSPIRVDIAGGLEEIPAIEKQTFDELANKAFNYPKFEGGIDSSLIYCDKLFLMFSYVPDWLHDVVEKSGEMLGYPIEAVKYMGSDHTVFAAAAIPATSIGKGGVPVHTPRDNISAISAESLEMITRLSEQILQRLLSVQIEEEEDDC